MAMSHMNVDTSVIRPNHPKVNSPIKPGGGDLTDEEMKRLYASKDIMIY